MPTGVQNYQNGKIYKIWSLMTNKIYIGSTTNDLPHRFKQHKNKNNKTNSKLLFQEVGIDNCKIELIHNFPTTSKNLLVAEEGRIVRLNKDFVVNRCIPGRTQKEYRNDYDDKLKINSALYRQNNKEIIAEKAKQLRKNNKGKINKYVEKNFEIINKKCECQCGGKYIYKHKSTHEKTKKHLKFSETLS